MKRKEIKELALKEVAELRTMLKDTQKEIVRAKMEITLGKTKNVHKVARMSDDIARIKTVLTRKNLAENSKEKK